MQKNKISLFTYNFSLILLLLTYNISQTMLNVYVSVKVSVRGVITVLIGHFQIKIIIRWHETPYSGHINNVFLSFRWIKVSQSVNGAKQLLASIMC